MDAQLDPFTECYKAIRTALLAVEKFRTLARANFPDATEESFELFPTTPQQKGDTPFIMLVQGQFGEMPYGANSKVTTVRQAYLVIVRNDKGLQVTPANKVKFYALLAMVKAPVNLGLDYVRDVTITNAADDPFGATVLKLGSIRYLTTLQINVEMDIDRQLLLAMANTP